MSIEIVPVSPARILEEDWYINVNGISRGYLYRSTNGYAVGITFKDKVEHFSIEPNTEAALAFAEKHLS